MRLTYFDTLYSAGYWLINTSNMLIGSIVLRMFIKYYFTVHLYSFIFISYYPYTVIIYPINLFVIEFINNSQNTTIN